MLKIPPPTTKQELLTRAKQIAGLTLEQLAGHLGVTLPQELTRAKGLVGQLIEQVLGANAGIQAKPDFMAIAVELKTIPINNQGKPIESTYVTTVPLLAMGSQCWRDSNVYKKLACVLWLPIQADETIAIKQRQIGSALLWNLPPAIEKILQQDWEELMELIAIGEVESITAKQGTYLQIRPKAADSSILKSAIGKEGKKIQTGPKGFYLRANFTEMILREAYL